MRLIKIFRRESPRAIAQEVVWRARRKWKKMRMLGSLRSLGAIQFRNVPYYKPNLESITKHTRALNVAFADEILAGRFPFLGYGTVELGTRPKWNVDFVSGAEWPYTPCDIRECIRHDGSDVKAPYELSRLQFLPVLGKAHILTGDEPYRRAAKDLLSNWIQSNPVPLGVNWTIAMEAALRAMSICFLLNLLSPFHSNEQPWLESVTRSLAQHLLFIEANVEFSYFLTSNHYLSDLVGLFCLSLFLSGEGMEARRHDYRKRIEAEMAKQVYTDGGDFEASTGYHVLGTQLFTTALLLMRTHEFSAETPSFSERLRLMFRYLNTLASADGQLPHVGDCDDGRVELFLDDLQQMLRCPVGDRNSLRVSQLLGLGQRLFGEGVGPGDDAVWYGFADTAQTPDCGLSSHCAGTGNTKLTRHPLNCSPSPLSPRERGEGEGSGVGGSRRDFQSGMDAIPDAADSITVLPLSGIGVLRHGSAELLFFAMPNGISGKGSHTHNDKLSFVLRIAGEEIFCDPGTGCYTREVATRNRFRRTSAHSTLLIDGIEQNRILPSAPGLFSLGNEAAVTPIEMGREARGRFLRASHKGYSPLGVTHTRTLVAIEGEQSFVIEDEIEGHGVHECEFNLQLAPHHVVEISGADNVLRGHVPGDRQVLFTMTGLAGLEGSVQPSSISRTYGTTVPAVKARVWGKAVLPARITTRISWVEVPESAINEAALPRESTLCSS